MWWGACTAWLADMRFAVLDVCANLSWVRLVKDAKVYTFALSIIKPCSNTCNWVINYSSRDESKGLK